MSAGPPCCSHDHAVTIISSCIRNLAFGQHPRLCYPASNALSLPWRKARGAGVCVYQQVCRQSLISAPGLDKGERLKDQWTRGTFARTSLTFQFLTAFLDPRPPCSDPDHAASLLPSTSCLSTNCLFALLLLIRRRIQPTLTDNNPWSLALPYVSSLFCARMSRASPASYPSLVSSCYPDPEFPSWYFEFSFSPLKQSEFLFVKFSSLYRLFFSSFLSGLLLIISLDKNQCRSSIAYCFSLLLERLLLFKFHSSIPRSGCS
nr:uncharacterized protein LOC133575375 [Nerophis lumbriciformis]